MEEDRLDNIFTLDLSYCCRIEEVRGPGRPREGGTDVTLKEVWTIVAEVVEMEDRAGRMSRAEMYVVFVTNIPRYGGNDFDSNRHPSKGLSTKEVLHDYKDQRSVECNFHVAKHSRCGPRVRQNGVPQGGAHDGGPSGRPGEGD